ncbi:hypothetical protein [Streptomyces sp. NPDC086766]|uniref:hypothetical protein n=1 Tax=Streptomyces sp. NPDC086766 TaxID=3365754 RepID=UPI00382FC8AE
MLLATAAVLAGTAGCTYREDAAAAQHTRPAPDRSAPPQPSQRPLATLKGQHRLVLTLTSARRDPGGSLTVRGTLTNEANESTVVSAQLEGNESDIVKNGPSLGGATLVDLREAKRYYVLRDTDGRPLTTTGLSTLAPHERASVYMQFPAPPASTRKVDFHLPQFDTATITVTG